VTPTESVGGERSALPGQVDALRALLRRNAAIGAILHGASTLGLPQWYLGAGCLAQTVWNVLSGVPAAQNILDYDLVYFDAADLSDEAEARQVRRAAALFGAQGVRVDLKNQARVHLWYESRFGRAIAPYGSTRDAIDCWPTTATAVAIRTLEDGLDLYAPFGVDDLLAMTVRPNRRQITRDVYLAKVRRWQACWPALTIVPWDA
jgi:hypothetical protein